MITNGEAELTPGAEERTEFEDEFSFTCIVCSGKDAYEILSECLHLACQKCVASLKIEDRYQCPLCKEYSKNVIRNPLLSKSDNVQKSPICNWCNDNGEQTKSVGNCKECDIWLCAECLKGHNRMPPLRNHSITMLTTTANQGSLHCEIHPNETLECFCEACGILTCRDCQLSVHRDHGSHRWVGEKANLLTGSLEGAVNQLERCREQLATSTVLVQTAISSTKDGSFLGSVEKTRLAIEARDSSLILRIRSRTDALLKELNSKSSESANRLSACDSLMTEIKERIDFVMHFANRLIKNKDTDPASLVQLFDALHARIKQLEGRAQRLVSDAPPSEDANELKGDHNDQDLSAWRKPTLGWRSTLNTRALFISNWNPEELARHSGSIAWLLVPQSNGDNATDKSGVKTEVPLPSSKLNGKHDTGLPESTAKFNEEYEEFLDSLAALDGRSRTSDSFTDHEVAGGVGCAICFGAGLLAHCGKCRRAYHLDCHLPRLTNICHTSGWVCGLCMDQDAATAAHVEQSDGTGLSHLDYLTGCRILMGLLVHAEAVHFTATVCPACSVQLLIPGRTVPHCPAGHLYHRLAELRLQLEEAASVESGGARELDDLEEHDELGGGGSPSGGRIRLTRLDDWLVEVDKFWSDAANEDNHIRGASKGCLRAARRLRASLASLIRVHRPQSLASFVDHATMDPDVPRQDTSSGAIHGDAEPMDQDEVLKSCKLGPE